MKSDRRFLLHLVALGSITPAEAERLLIACNEEREVLWACAAGIAAMILTHVHLPGVLWGIERARPALAVVDLNFTRHALALATYLFGGVL